MGRVSSLIFTVVAVAIIGTVYANLGGLRAVQFQTLLMGSDCLALIPILALKTLESVAEGWILLTTAYPEKFNSIGSGTDPTPF